MLIQSRGSLLVLPLFALGASSAVHAADVPANLADAYGNVPLQFEANQGQVDDAARFLAHGAGYELYVTSVGAVLVLAKPSANTADKPTAAVALRMSVIGARPSTATSGLNELPGKANYFIGNDASQWRSNVPTYAKVRHNGVYPGVDLVYYGRQRQLEYDFVVAPGSNPDQIVLGFDGADFTELDAQGDLVLHTGAGDVRQHKPIVYQEADGVRHTIRRPL